MPQVRPFQGWRYNAERAGDPSATTCPPYDVISPEQQRGFYASSPYNVIRLELGETRPDDNPANNRYTRARDELQGWQRDGVLTQDAIPAFYLYEQQFDGGNGTAVRRALLSAMAVEPWSQAGVMPHEETMSGPKADRLELLRTVQANVSPIFGLYPDDDGAVAALLDDIVRRTPDVDFLDEVGERHRLWVAVDTVQNAAISAALATRPVLIADGHHRYETALGYSTQQGAPPAADAILIALVADDDPGLRIYPTHRTVQGVDAAAIESLAGRAGEVFDIQPGRGLADATPETIEQAIAASAMPSFVVAGLPEGRVSLVTPRGSSHLPEGKSADWAGLDLVALHHQLLVPYLGIDVDQEGEGRVVFTRDLPGALEGVQAGSLQLAAFLHPPRATDIRAVAAAGDRMPHKSTYFYPKMRTGMVIRSLLD